MTKMANKTFYVVTVMKGDPTVVDGIPNGACAVFTFPDEAAEYAAELNGITEYAEGGEAYFFKVVSLELDNTDLLDKLIEYYSEEGDE
jgi:DNA-binding beta-propeller fold protein YncE